MNYTIISNPVLIPVVELEPSRFGEMDFPPPPWSDQVACEYWRACLSQSGLGHLVPVATRSWLVRLSDLTEEAALGVILRSHLDRFAPENDDRESDELSPLFGGFALFDDADPILLPQCCGDFANLESWQLAAKHRGSDPVTVWIGHPWIEAKYDAPNLLLWSTSERGEAADAAPYAVQPDALASAAASAHAALVHFSSHVLAPQLSRMGVKDSSSGSQRLLGLPTS